MKSSNASAVVFGFQFQVDAAICIFIRNIKDIYSMNVEGKFQDVEFTDVKNRKSLCQIKSVHNPSSTKKQYSKLKDAIKSLCQPVPYSVHKYIYCSNQKDPLINESHLFSSDDILLYSFNELDNNSKRRIERYIGELVINDKNTIQILKIPYNVSSDTDTKRIKIIKEIEKFLIDVQEKEAYATRLASTWHDYFANKATQEEFLITKEEFVWIIIATILNQKAYTLNEECDFDVEDITEQYESFIKDKINNFEISNFILSFYEEEKKGGLSKDVQEFFTRNILQFQEKIFSSDKREDINELERLVMSLIVKTIINIRLRIINIKKGANL